MAEPLQVPAFNIFGFKVGKPYFLMSSGEREQVRKIYVEPTQRLMKAVRTDDFTEAPFPFKASRRNFP